MNSGLFKVLCVDDSPEMCDALAQSINADPELEFVGALGSADALLETIAATTPAVVLLDLTMPGKCPFEAMKEAQAKYPDVRFLVLSGRKDPHSVDQSLNFGAWGYVCKHDDVQQLMLAIKKVARGEMVLIM